MRIRTIELAWFRGAAGAIALEPNAKSMVVYGENGSGKSSFVDAVEYVLNNGSIEHLRTEYSGTRQVNAIPNTHKPANIKPTLRFKFQDSSELKIEFNPNGSSRRSGGEGVAMGDWEYRQTVLRQDEVAKFIHNTKGEKYSALLPLFGLHKLEVAAENLRKLRRTVEDEAKAGEKKARLQQSINQRQATFADQSDEQIVEAIHELYERYCGGDRGEIDALSLCGKTKIAIDDRISQFSADDRRYVAVKEVAESNLKDTVEGVRAASVKLAESIDSNISEKLAVLQAARAFAETIEAATEINCPACGQTMTSEAFGEHVKTETARLKELENTFDAYKAAVGSVSSCLELLKSNLRKPDLKGWKDGFVDPALFDGLQYLELASPDTLRENCSLDDLNSIQNKLLPIVATAVRDTKGAPPDVQTLTGDKNRLNVAETVISSRKLQAEIDACEDLMSVITALEQEVRSQIRQKSQAVIDTISQDVESMWSALHPGETIDCVGLSLPADADKAIDVVLKFHGRDQDSPRLTLSEGFRNSLGLCIFLAMAKQVVDRERPLFLDDVVVSLDRHHRGMIQGLIETEFNDRQVIIFTHDREWYTELRQQLGGDQGWIFRTLLPYETPDIGIRWSSRDSTFDDARAMLAERPDSAGNDARKIMDQELPLIAEKLKTSMPFLRSERNDRRGAHEFLERLIADGKKCFQKRAGTQHVANTDAVDALETADRLLVSWGNRGSHTFDVVRPEAIALIDACEAALATFQCKSCDPRTSVWRLDDENSERVQCRCGELRWRYGRA